MNTKLANAIREIATHLQVGDTVRAHAMMEAVAIYEGVETSSVYAVSEQVAQEATSLNVAARDMTIASTPLEASLHRIDSIRTAA